MESVSHRRRRRASGRRPLLVAGSPPQGWELGEEPFRLDLEEQRFPGEACKVMSTEAAELDVRTFVRDRDACLVGDNDLATVTGRAHAGGRVHGQPDVPAIGQGDEAAMEPDADS